MDGPTGYRTAGTVTARKDTDSVLPVPEGTKESAGKVPAMFVSDKDRTYHNAWGMAFGPKNPACKRPHYTTARYTRTAARITTLMERFNGGLHTRIRTMRGRGGNTCMMLLLQTYYNHIRPHTSPGGGMMPG